MRTASVGLAVVPFSKLLVACGASDDDATPDAASADDTGASPLDAAGPEDTSTGRDAGSDAGPTAAWATGGTAAMIARDRYPNPFAGSGGSSCVVTCGATLGPCHTTSPERRDVSDGWDGLPVRLALRVVDERCDPVPDAIVEIWHTSPRGIYSGQIAAICNTDAEDRAAGYFRGYLRTDADGRVDFDTCFPGWYPGRAIHVHYRVMTGAYDPADSAPAEVISQLFFDDALVSELFGSEPVYREFGQPDTTNGTDGVLGRADPTPYVCDIARLPDGAMQASKTIVLRSVGAACTIGR
ncbi:MAG: intradiol ring-cleavage dioxygenase [Deltaproteobacteria bacterium]|nr:intradiol ring-cleavage dioxygenase [Deltaproteobacteria bacterium]